MSLKIFIKIQILVTATLSKKKEEQLTTAIIKPMAQPYIFLGRELCITYRYTHHIKKKSWLTIIINPGVIWCFRFSDFLPHRFICFNFPNVSLIPFYMPSSTQIKMNWLAQCWYIPRALDIMWIIQHFIKLTKQSYRKHITQKSISFQHKVEAYS